MEYKAPIKVPTRPDRVKIFLAGTIDMGNSENWQEKLNQHFKSKQDLYPNIDLINPRRDDWDNSWVQKYEDDNFNRQVSWEITNLDNCDLIIMNFLGGSQSPITLLELGLMAKSGKLIVICSDTFWRKGNVEIVCDKYNIPLYDDYDTFYNEYLHTEQFWKWYKNKK